MQKWCRLSKEKQVIETFNFDPFVWIPNPEFLKDVMECPEYVEPNMWLVDDIWSDTGLPNMSPSLEDVAKAEREIETLNLLIELGVIV